MNSEPTDINERVVMAALEFATAGRWHDVAIPEIATAAGISAEELHDLFPVKSAIIAAFVKKIDRQVVGQEFGFEKEDTPRDRLFEILMSRFDALDPHRAAVRTLSRDLKTDPMGMLCLSSTAMISANWILETANIPSSGPFGLLRANGLLAVWLGALHVWLADDSPDLSRTMAALDRYLRRTERAAIEIQRFEELFLKFRETETANELDNSRE